MLSCGSCVFENVSRKYYPCKGCDGKNKYESFENYKVIHPGYKDNYVFFEFKCPHCFAEIEIREDLFFYYDKHNKKILSIECPLCMQRGDVEKNCVINMPPIVKDRIPNYSSNKHVALVTYGGNGPYR
jgi:hypothetical protein